MHILFLVIIFFGILYWLVNVTTKAINRVNEEDEKNDQTNAIKDKIETIEQTEERVEIIKDFKKKGTSTNHKKHQDEINKFLDH